jgi:hypothetical protein
MRTRGRILASDCGVQSRVTVTGRRGSPAIVARDRYAQVEFFGLGSQAERAAGRTDAYLLRKAALSPSLTAD